MNNKQHKTLKAIFSEPIRRNIPWSDVVSLIKGLGGEVIQGSGSRVRFDLNQVALNIHSPHPGNELKRYQVQAVRDFLLKAGINDEI
ncbi:MAG: type II toxin-antitoxin system HicA family toxin [Acaryochloris sp. RU_4_1]|nr:type II toxin-antitoxin system HicA family toxin [Acaryochloris sp. RU_4_1]